MVSTERTDLETRVDNLEVAKGVTEVHLEQIKEVIDDGRSRFHEIADALQDHAIAIELLKAVKSDVAELKENMSAVDGTEHERKGFWMAVVGICAIISFLFQFGGSIFHAIIH